MNTKDYVLMHAGGNLFWKDREGRYLGCNVTFANIAGLDSPDDIIGQSDRDLFLSALGEEGIQRLVDIDQYVMTQEVEKTIEETGVDESGNKAYFLTRKIPLRNHDGTVIGLVGNSIDITKQKQADMLKSAFIQNMEHDIRTPISGIYGLTDSLHSTETDENKKQTLAMVSEAAKELLDYCNNLLDFTKLEAGPQPITEKPFSLRKLIDSIVKLEKPAANQKQLELSYSVSEDFPNIILSDESRIRRILLNLIGNSLKFTQAGAIIIEARKAAELKNRYFVLELSVQDTGIGIPEDKQNLVYQKYVKVSPSNKGIYKGTGLGLSMVQQFISELDGEIQLESQVGMGSIFTLLIPVRRSLSDEEAI